jgi:hypothetical protein
MDAVDGVRLGLVVVVDAREVVEVPLHLGVRLATARERKPGGTSQLSSVLSPTPQHVIPT